MRRSGPLYCLVLIVSVPSSYLAGVDDFAAHYRFEAGECLEIIDSLSGTAHGRTEEVDDGAPVWSKGVPVEILPLTLQTNTLSLDFTGQGWIHIDGMPFPFHEPRATSGYEGRCDD